MYAIVCILVMDDLWNCLPQKKNVSSFREGSQTPAKTHENCDLQVFFYKISFKTYLPLKPPQHIPTYPNNIVQGPPLQSLQSQGPQSQGPQPQGPRLQCWRYRHSISLNQCQGPAILHLDTNNQTVWRLYVKYLFAMRHYVIQSYTILDIDGY